MKKQILCLTLSLLIGTAGNAFASDDFTPPIPPKRPKVMSASPAFIESLKLRAKNESPIGVSISEDDVVDLSAQDVLAAISPSSSDPLEILDVPIPAVKPQYAQNLSVLDDQLEGAEGGRGNARLVSFAINAGQTDLDQNLEYFLENHALDMLEQDRNVGIEVQAYSSAQDNSGHSDMRLSLARALEVRKFLINHQVDASRIKLTPLGTDAVTKSTDRIDLLFY